MGYGTGPYGLAPYGSFSLTYTEEPTVTRVTSRRINNLGLYEQDEDGNFLAMDDIAQRVLLKLAYGLNLPKVFGADFDTLVGQAVRAALADMTAGRQPEIRILSIETENEGGTGYLRLRYFNLTTNQDAALRFPTT